MRFFRELDPFASHVAVAALAIATWVFLIIPLWRRWRPRLLLPGKNNLLKKRLAAAWVSSQSLIPRGEQSGLLTPIAATETGSLYRPMKSCLRFWSWKGRFVSTY